MSKKEESIYRRKSHISIILGRISTSASSVEMFQQIANLTRNLKNLN